MEEGGWGLDAYWQLAGAALLLVLVLLLWAIIVLIIINVVMEAQVP